MHGIFYTQNLHNDSAETISKIQNDHIDFYNGKIFARNCVLGHILISDPENKKLAELLESKMITV